MIRPCAVLILAFLHPALVPDANAQAPAPAASRTVDVPFTTHDGHPMFGKLTLPGSGAPQAVLIYVQTAEGATADMKRPLGGGKTFNYFDLYREKLPPVNVAFFSYEGRGIRNGDSPPRYEQIDWDVYNSSTLENKVRDVLSAIAAVRKHEGMKGARVFLMGASEGTLLAAEAASRAPVEVSGLVLYGVMSGTMRETFRFIMTDGGFMAYRGFFDTDKDGRISKAEFEADPRKYRERVFKNAGFENFDKDGDGFFDAGDMKILTKPYLDAIDQDNYAVLDQWAKTAAGVSTPAGWFKDHFNHQPIWTFLSKLDVPIGLFQGSLDNATSIDGVKKLEEQARQAGKTNMRFHYFEGLDHTLNIAAYFARGTMPEGHKAIFEFIESQVRK